MAEEPLFHLSIPFYITPFSSVLCQRVESPGTGN